MALAAWFHDLSPFAIRLTDTIGLRWYGLSYAAAFAVGWLLLKWLGKRGASRIPPDRAGDAILAAVVGVIVGGRLGYVFFYDPTLLWSFSGDVPFWGVLAINRGGMASHGGLIGVIVAAFFIASGFKDESGVRRGKSSVLHVLDSLALITPSGLMLGRLANFVNGELLGREYAGPAEPAPWWTVRFPQEVVVVDAQGAMGLPARSPEELLRIERIMADAGITGGGFEARYHTLLDKIQHGRADLAGQLEPLIYARYPSQLMQAAAEGLVLGALVWLVARRPRLTGVVGCWFMIGYGVLRVATEVWRLPDANLVHQRIAGLSRGQWLSVGMVLVGAVALGIIVRRGGAKLGGWGGRGAAAIPSGS